ncbi:MAG: hypothetical protein J6C77_05130 [Muribaculaceae bacterium]|nr:hypothetical protein [Muribaculaceae bacterium]
MKKILSILTILALCAGVFTACDDDDDKAPQVKISFTYGSTVKVVDGDLYVVKGTPFTVDAINCTAVRPNTTAMVTGPVSYWLDAAPMGTTYVSPFGVSLDTDALAVGRHFITVQMGIAEEGCALAMAVAEVDFNVVSEESQIPTPGGDDSSTQPIDYTLK